MELKPFDQYVQEAQREPLRLLLPDGDTVSVPFPTGESLQAFQRAMAAANLDGAVASIFAEPDAAKMVKLFRGAPADVFGRVLDDIATAFGVSMTPGGSTG